MVKKSEFRKLMEKVFEQNGINLKEWDEPEELKYAAEHPHDHTGSDIIEWTLDLPMNDELRDIIIRNNIVGIEDLQDDNGNWNPTEQFDCKIEYNISGYPDDEEINVTKVYLYDTDITPFLSSEYKQTVAEELEGSGKIDLNYNDPVEEWRSDYYHSVL